MKKINQTAQNYEAVNECGYISVYLKYDKFDINIETQVRWVFVLYKSFKANINLVVSFCT